MSEPHSHLRPQAPVTSATGLSLGGSPHGAPGGQLSAESGRGAALFEHTPVACFLVALDGTIIELNQAGAELLASSREQLVGKNLLRFFDSVSSRHFTEHLVGVYEERRGRSMNAKLRPIGEGGVRHLTIISRLMEGDQPACLSACLDLTEQHRTEEAKKQLERQLVNTQRLESLGQLAGGIAHDFNNLLTGILGHAELLEMSNGLEDPDRQCVAMIRKAATSAARLCQQMLTSAGRSAGTIDRVNLNDAIVDAVALVSVSLNKNVSIVRRLAEDLPAVSGDFAQLNHAVLNLLINAEEALGNESGSIEVGTRVTRLESGYRDVSYFGPDVPPGDYVEVWVADSGVGMSPVTLSHIFDPFYTTKFTGRGLGLSTVFGTVRWHNGTIAVRSAPGVGATFRLFFPAQASPAGTPSGQLPKVRESRSLAGRRILLVEDEEPVRQVVSTLLERAGAEVQAVPDGRTAIDVFRDRSTHFTHILLDLIMPGMTGEQTLEALQQLGLPLPPVIVLSGYAGPEIQARLRNLGVASQLQKPCSIVELTTEIMNAR